MRVNFNYIGLDFDADVKYQKGFPGNPEEPAEGASIEITKLWLNQDDFTVLLDSDLRDGIYEAAYGELGQALEDEKADYGDYLRDLRRDEGL
jgi:hypothetical protein